MALTLDHLQQREEHWAIVDLVGKGGHVRTVPVPDWVRTELDDWLAAAAIESRQVVPPSQQNGKSLGRWDDGKGRLAHCEGIRQKHWSSEVGTARSATDLCSALPRIGRRVGADSISLRARFRADDRTLPWLQAADSISRQ